MEFVTDRASKAPFDPGLKLNERVKQEAFARGLACYPMGGTLDGRRGDHAILAPPTSPRQGRSRPSSTASARRWMRRSPACRHRRKRR
ncbi:hypothetical protein ACFQY5_15050 [Paeniroseomonas aquatica]|uniref:hypothetical protein n=1 Tax=Paeniroseomonas aquatica TaxID=373043 RepID=UPI003615E23E